jgi:NarL family two-component system response regulator LiaR
MCEIIRVLVADDHAIVREGLRALIGTEAGMELVGEAADGEETVRLAEILRPDVILLDLVMPHKDGLAAIRELKADNPDVHILVLTSFGEDDKVFGAIKTGALGYLLKDSAPREVLRAVREVARGEASLHPTIARKLIRELNQPDRRPPTDEPLTDREVEVLRLVAHGLSNQEIAERFVISERTVRTHVSSILAKLHLASRTQAALYALRQGIASFDTP